MSQKNKKGGFFRSLLGILGASLGEVQLQQAKEQLEQLKKNLIQPHPLTNFEIQKHYQKEPKFNGVYSRNNLSKIKDGAFIINLDDYESIGTHWILCMLIIIMKHTLIVLELNIFQKKLENFLEINMFQQIFIE